MRSVTSKDIQTFFLYKNSTYSTDKAYNIILSPEFYWCRVFDIPVDSKKKIQKILPTLFEDILPHDSFEYHAIKLENKKHICFAYESSEIIEAIKDSGLNISKLQNIYFAQTELLKFTPFKIQDLAYVLKDESLIQIPQRFVKDDTPVLNIEKIKLSKHKIKLNIHQNMINLRNIYILSSIFFIVAIINFIVVFSLNSDINQIDTKKQDIIQQYNLPRTSIQLNSILKTLKVTNSKQIEIRALLFDIFNIHKKYPNSKVKHIQFNKKIYLEVSNLSFNKLKTLLNNYTIKQVPNNSNTLKVEISL